MSHFGQLNLMLRKNLLVRRRTLFFTFLEVMVPLIYAALLFLTRVYSPDINAFREDKTMAAVFSESTPLSEYKYTVIGYAPKSPATDKLMKLVEQEIFQMPWFHLENHSYGIETIGFKSEFSMMKFALNNPGFLEYSYAFDNVSYDTNILPETLHIIMRLKNNGSKHIKDFEMLHEVEMLEIVMQAYIHYCSRNDWNISISYKQLLPNLQPRLEGFLLYDMHRIGLIIVGLCAYLIWRNIYMIASERERKILMLMEQVGMNTVVYWLSWLITTIIIFEVICMCFAAMLFVPLDTEPVLKNSEVTLVIAYFGGLGFSLSCYCIMGSVLFEKAENCSAISSILFLLVTFPTLEAPVKLRKNRLASMLFNSIGIISSLTHMGQMEYRGVGHRWDRDVLKFPEFSASSQFLNGILYLSVAWLFYSFVRSGKPKGITCQYWDTCRNHPEPHKIIRDGKTYSRIGIRVEKLCVNGPKKLKDVTFIMLEDSITVLTGHEMSGKKVLMSVLKGRVRPSHGTVTVYGLDIVKNLHAIKLVTGLCPKEETAIFQELTVYENLLFFSILKNMCQMKQMSNIKSLVDDFNLNSVLDVAVKHLCPSDRRMVQVAMAFLGDNKVILLEYPSLNMDVQTKYTLWTTIRAKAKQKTIVINSNNISQAEMVGDRIAIFLNEELYCCGTMQFINLALGAGYHLSIKKKEDCCEERVEHLIYNLVMNSALVNDHEEYMTFWLPMKATESFNSLFTILCKHKRKLGIEGFYINSTTLHDAVINLSEYDEIKKTPIRPNSMDQALQGSSYTSLQYMRVASVLDNVLSEMSFEDEVSASTTKENVSYSKPRLSFEHCAEYFSSDAFFIHAILKSMAKSRLTGDKLLWAQFRAMMKKRLILHTCYIHIEFFLMAILLLMSYWVGSNTSEMQCDMLECSKDLNMVTFLHAYVPHNRGNNNATRKMSQIYQNLFIETGLKTISFDETTGNMTDMTVKLRDLKVRPIIGAVFSSPQNTNIIHADAYYLVDDIDNGYTLIQSVSAVMNTLLQFVTKSSKYQMRISTQHQRKDMALNTTLFKKNTIDIANRFSHHASILNAVALLLVPYYLVLERQTGSKNMQILSGAKPFLYYTTAFIFDLATYLFMSNSYSLGAKKGQHNESVQHVLYKFSFLYLINGIMMILYIYVMQLWFTSASVAVGFMMIFDYSFGYPFSTFIRFTTSESITLGTLVLFSVCLLIPSHILPQATYHILYQTRMEDYCQEFFKYCSDPESNNFVLDCCQEFCRPQDKCLIHDTFISVYFTLNWQLITMVIHICFWALLLYLIETKAFLKFRRLFHKEAESMLPSNLPSLSKELPTRDRRHLSKIFHKRYNTAFILPQLPLRTASTWSIAHKGIIFKNVEKVEDDTMVVSNISLHIEEGDLFCLAGSDIEQPSLGLKMICGLDVPTSGEILVNGEELKPYCRPKVPHIGYCAERTSGVLPTMTGFETLQMYARLRGVSDDNIKRLVEIYLAAFHLESVAAKHADNDSDCELRRLTVAAALIGEPDFCLLCDPLYKLDSESKEIVMRWLKRMTNLKKTIVISSDSLQEIGKHATCIMIMIDGRAVCLGTAAHIEFICCKGYTLLVKLDPNNKPGSAALFLALLQDKLPQCLLFHGHEEHLYFQLPYEEESLAEVFATCESLKKKLKIVSYRVNRTTLDQVLTATQNAYFVHKLQPNQISGGDRE